MSVVDRTPSATAFYGREQTSFQSQPHPYYYYYYYLRLFILIPNDNCLSSNGLFNFTASIQDTMNLNIHPIINNWAFNNSNNHIEQYIIPLSDCILTNNTYMNMLTLYRNAQQYAQMIKSNQIDYNVIIGPYHPNLCYQMNQLIIFNLIILYENDNSVNDPSQLFAIDLAYLLMKDSNHNINVKAIYGWNIEKNISNIIQIGNVEYSGNVLLFLL
ncbi:unnamed protein product [Schistosoma mattheei]|uniref:Uncharacterized protein n=1 Tax=Schistosoma mattheei TaxID=31246 RepID=A0A183PWS1_9TREM|nr:unnamed protein product [Schistosoma mattheei]